MQIINYLISNNRIMIFKMRNIFCIWVAVLLFFNARATISFLDILDPFGLFRMPTSYENKPKKEQVNPHPLGKILRSQDGSGNNQRHSQYGKTGAELQRLTKAAYADGKSSMIYRGNPRQISNIMGFIGQNQQTPQNSLGLNMLYVLFGQFVDHDLDLTSVNFKEIDVIPVPKFDSTFDQLGSGLGTITFWRSQCSFRNGQRIFANQITSWIDGNQIYGSTQEAVKKLRSFKQGKLRMDNNLLPRDSQGQFQAGDVRVGQNSGLASLHTLFAREHNRQCDEILRRFPSMSDEQIFQVARNKVIGLLQKITFRQFLPLLLGPNAYDHYIGSYKGYNNSFNPTVNIQFSTAAYRIGHPLLYHKIDIYDYQNCKTSSIPLQNMFMAHEHIKNQQEIDYLLNGMMRSISKKKNNQLVNGLRNLLIEFPNIKQDLFSLNVKRGRDHGIPDYNTVRRMLGFSPITSFSQISEDAETVSRLNKAYKFDCDNLDLWVGIISQDSLPGGQLGEVGAAIVGETFRRVRDGDRFWYENAYPSQEISQIESTKLGDIIERNTRLRQVPADSFKLESSQKIEKNLQFVADKTIPTKININTFSNNNIKSFGNYQTQGNIINQYEGSSQNFVNLKKY